MSTPGLKPDWMELPELFDGADCAHLGELFSAQGIAFEPRMVRFVLENHLENRAGEGA